MDKPKRIRILAADAVGRRMGVEAAVSVIQDGPEDQARLARLDVVLDDLWLGA